MFSVTKSVIAFYIVPRKGQTIPICIVLLQKSNTKLWFNELYGLCPIKTLYGLPKFYTSRSVSF